MGDVLVLDRSDSGAIREALPWYRDPTLVGSTHTDSGFAVARFLPQDTYLPADYVLATLTAALWWGKAVEVSWMQMDFQEAYGAETPMQHHRRGAAIFYIDDDSAYFGVVGAEDTEPQRVNTDLVTDIRLVIPTPKPHRTRHTQRDGTTVLWSHVTEADMAQDGFVPSGRNHLLDDGTTVPIYVDERGYEFSPVVVVSQTQQDMDRRERVEDDLRWRGVQVDG